MSSDRLSENSARRGNKKAAFNPFYVDENI
jgi:hypothetical protein